MKSLYSTLSFVAAVSLFAACTAEKDVIREPEVSKVLVTFTAEKAGENTKTAVEVGESSVSYVWTEEDASSVKVFQITTTTDGDGNETEKSTELENPTVSISSDGKLLTITAEATEAESYLFRANVAGDRTSGGSPRVKGAQSPADASFDPTTDILVADDLSTTTLENLAFTFRRQVVVNEMTLKNLIAGEKVSEVKIVSDKHLTGYYGNGSMTGQATQITLSYDKVEVPESGQLTTWFVTMPNTEHTLTVTVTTDAHVYTKTFAKTINFNLGSYTRFGVALPEPEEIADYSGEWVMTGTDGENSFAATAYSSGTFYPASAVTIDSDTQVVTVTGDAATYKMTLTLIEEEGDYKGLYTIKDANGNYLTAYSTEYNYLKGVTTPQVGSYWNVSKGTDGLFDIVAFKYEGRNILRANYNNGSPRFACYASTTTVTKVVLYPFDKIHEDESYEFTTVAELNALVTSTSKTYKGALTNAVVSFVPAANTAIIKDATGSIMYYKSSHGLLQGQTFSGEITVTAIKYNSLYSEITAFTSDSSFTGDEISVSPETVTLAQLNGNYDVYQNAYVKVENMTVVSQSGKNINVTDGTNTYVVYDNTGNISVNANDVITAEGTITKYSTTEELKVWAADDLTIVSSAVATPSISCQSNTVTISCETDGATIYYTTDGSDPTTASAVYSEPFAITETVTVKAFAVKEGSTDSGIASASCVYTSGSAPDPDTITFANLGLENGVQYSDPFDGGNFTITFAGGSNDGKYYTTGSGIRTYGGGSITIASTEYNIVAIKFTWDGSNAPTSDVANPEGYSKETTTWTGSAKSVVLTRPSGSGHWRLQSVTVTYE